jgi:hypothetical protein
MFRLSHKPLGNHMLSRSLALRCVANAGASFPVGSIADLDAGEGAMHPSKLHRDLLDLPASRTP